MFKIFVLLLAVTLTVSYGSQGQPPTGSKLEESAIAVAQPTGSSAARIERCSRVDCPLCRIFFLFLQNWLRDQDAKAFLRKWTLEKVCRNIDGAAKTCKRLTGKHIDKFFEVITETEPLNSCVDVGLCKTRGHSSPLIVNVARLPIEHQSIADELGQARGGCIEMFTGNDDQPSEGPDDEDIEQLVSIIAEGKDVPN